MAELQVSKTSIGKLFSEMQNKKFTIPDYQRPYKWDLEKCETLWNDIETFAQTDAKGGSDYFLGTIVYYPNEEKNHEVIDGQQRITSFFLLLRSFYRKLEDMEEDEDVIGLKNQVGPCIWDTNMISQKVTDKSKIHIVSLVATEEDNETFHRILETGIADESASDNYSKNYLFFKQKCDEYASDHPMQWKELCVTILNKCIVLPIECDTQATALTIFSTLNDRGMPLADSDIFKAQLYKNTESEIEKKLFTTAWKELTEICRQGNLKLDDVFRYYTHVLRGRADEKGKEVGLRKYYAENKYSRLKKAELMEEIKALANFWRDINEGIESDDDFNYSISKEARKYLHCLKHYPNDFWKYATSVFFVKNRNSKTFESDFSNLLKELIAFLFTKFIEKPTVNAIKDDIYNSCISLDKENKLQYKISFDKEILKKAMDKHHSSRISRALLLLDAYLDEKQEEIIPSSFDIEHIFPKKWQDTNYNGWNKDDAAKYLDRLGNKIVLEKKINIKAGNGYFGVKKERYKKSTIATIQNLSYYPNNDWVKEDIETREELLKNNIITFFKTNLR